ncbi:MAG: hypothetical protein KY469_06765 [Actinobacteria bacterium]|nr:hypothetical protein [Actinomycetota bacterium]
MIVLLPRLRRAAGARRLGTLATSRLVGAGLAAWLVLFGAVQVGLSTPDRELLSGASGGVALDYSALRGTIAQLTEAFIAEVLGLAAPSAADADAVSPPPGPAAGAPALAAEADPPVVPAARVEVTHPPDNDTFDEAYEVPSVPFTATTDASSASRQPGEPDSCARAGPTLWYRYTTERTVGLTAHVAARGSATALGVFVGASLDDLDVLGCDDTLSGASGVRFPAEAGTTYFFQVSAPLGAREIRFALDPLGTTTRVPHLGDATWSEASCLPVDVHPYFPIPHPAKYPAMSADGRYVVYESYHSATWPYRCAESQVPLGDDEYQDVFLYDRVTGVTEQVSVNSDGEPGNERSGSAVRNAVSADGRYVAFWSAATNLVPNDTNDEWDLFVRDRHTGQTTRVSVSSHGEQGTPPPPETLLLVEAAICERFGGRDGPPVRDSCYFLREFDMTPDGRYVVFWSWMRGLVEEPDGWGPTGLDSRSVTAVYRHDRWTGETMLASLPEHADANMPSISADGNVVVYRAWDGGEIQPIDGGPQYNSGFLQAPQVYARDLRTGETVHASLGYDGQPANGATYVPIVSDDGRFVAFSSQATNLWPRDVNSVADVFVYDLETGVMEMATVNSAGEPQVADQQIEQRIYFNQIRSSISADGRYVTFESAASNLAPESPGEHHPETGNVNCAPGTDAFVRDRVAGTTTRVSVATSGEAANGCTRWSFISSDGSTVVFSSQADNLDENDHNGLFGYDLFLHDFWVPL